MGMVRLRFFQGEHHGQRRSERIFEISRTGICTGDRESKGKMKALLAQVDGNAAADVRFCLRLVDRELVARADLFRLQARR